MTHDNPIMPQKLRTSCLQYVGSIFALSVGFLFSNETPDDDDDDGDVLRLFYGCVHRIHLSGDNSQDRCAGALVRARERAPLPGFLFAAMLDCVLCVLRHGFFPTFFMHGTVCGSAGYSCLC